MHDDNRHAALSGELQHLITYASPPDVVQHVRPRVERRGGHLNLLGVGAQRQCGQHASKPLNGGSESGDLVCR
jgi:hypothetical protein